MVIIDIYADFVCPWCYLGLRRFSEALADWQELKPVLHWQGYQLNPEIPHQGVSRSAYLTEKFGSLAQAVHAYAGVRQAFATDGLHLDLDRITIMPNTLDAHRLIRYADRLRQAQAGDSFPNLRLIEALFHAFLVRGRNIGDRRILADLAAQQGLEEEACMAYLESEADVSAVQTADLAARRSGIQAVPSFVFNRRHSLIGSQDKESFAPLFTLARLEVESQK